MSGLFCRLLGHAIPTGYRNIPGEGYLGKRHIIVDGMGITHIQLTAQCRRCDATFNVGRVHVTQKDL